MLGLGWLLGVGPGRERRLPAVAGGDRLHPLGRRAASAGHAPGLELRARDLDVRPDDPRHVPHPIGSDRLGPQLHPVGRRSGAARLPRRGRRRLARSCSRCGFTWLPRRLGSSRWPAAKACSSLNNLLLTLFAFTVLVGTMYPLLVEAFSGRQVSVGRPFFDRVTLPDCLCAAAGDGHRADHPVPGRRGLRGVGAHPHAAARCGWWPGPARCWSGCGRCRRSSSSCSAPFVISVIVRHFWVAAAAGAHASTACGRAQAADLAPRRRVLGRPDRPHRGRARCDRHRSVDGAGRAQEVRLDVGRVPSSTTTASSTTGRSRRRSPTAVSTEPTLTLYRADCTHEIRTMAPRLNDTPTRRRPSPPRMCAPVWSTTCTSRSPEATSRRDGARRVRVPADVAAVGGGLVTVARRGLVVCRPASRARDHRRGARPLVAEVRRWSALGNGCACASSWSLGLLPGNAAPVDQRREGDCHCRRICGARSAAVSPSPRHHPRSLVTSRSFIVEKVDEGWTDDEIYAFFEARYGERVRLDPADAPAGASRCGSARWSWPGSALLAISRAGGGSKLPRSLRRGHHCPEVVDA